MAKAKGIHGSFKTDTSSIEKTLEILEEMLALQKDIDAGKASEKDMEAFRERLKARREEDRNCR